MNTSTSKTAKEPVWQKTPYANLIRYKSSGKYFARLRVRGKLIRRGLKTTSLPVAKLRLSDLEKGERQKAQHQTAVADGNMTFGAALAIYRQRLNANAALKPRSQVYREERIAALVKSWIELEKKDVRKISKHECLTWAARYAEKRPPPTSIIPSAHCRGALHKVL